jgi:DNA helicase-2/ATP-dependent DNA helicase PcrA
MRDIGPLLRKLAFRQRARKWRKTAISTFFSPNSLVSQCLPMKGTLMPDLFDFHPTPQQSAFFDFAGDQHNHAVLEACAGSGKTKTLVRGLRRMRGTKFLGAFNTAIAGELQKQVKADDPRGHTVTAATMHSAGFSAWRQRHPKAGLDQFKTRKVFRQLAGERGFDASKRYIDYSCTMVGHAMNAGLGLGDPRDLDDDTRWQAISDHFSADSLLDTKVSNVLTGIRWARETLKRSVEMCPELISFDEMLYAPLFNGAVVQRFDNVLIDEAQDSNATRIILAERMLAEHGRLFAVGDRRQSIYGFNGADPRAMQNIIERFAATVFPLSISFRCARAVVEYAQRFVGPHIEAAPDAPVGIARRIGLSPDWWQDEDVAVTDAILCRYNAPLVKLAYGFLRSGVPCRMAGREDLGAHLKQLARRWDTARTLDGLDARLDQWLSDEIDAARTQDRPERANAANDSVETMRVLIDRCRDAGRHQVSDLVEEIGRLFVKPDRPAVLLSSIHKAKGKEWPRVFWMQTRPKFTGARQEWQDDQEVNLQYVAATRAMRELVLVQE